MGDRVLGYDHNVVPRVLRNPGSMSRTTAEYVGYDPLRVLRFVHERVFFGEHKVLTIPPFIPVREHGAWVMIIAPMVSGMLFAPELSWNMLLYGIAVLCVFMAYPSAEQLFRIWSGAHRTAEERCGARVWTAVFVLTGVAAVIPLLWQGYGIRISCRLVLRSPRCHCQNRARQAFR
ncbi:MAG: YwiC-like family protein [Bacteroidetes bacterium]|nr:MAG: YwiC-like family protein [Bacteroidota bacterium]